MALISLLHFPKLDDMARFAACLVLAFFTVKGFLSWLADVSIWALRLLDPSDKENDND